MVESGVRVSSVVRRVSAEIKLGKIGSVKKSARRMGNDKVVSLAAPAAVENAMTKLLRTGARRLIEAAVAAELEGRLTGGTIAGRTAAAGSQWPPSAPRISDRDRRSSPSVT